MIGRAWQNPEIERLRPTGRYSRDSIDRIEAELQRHGTLSMAPLSSGLFPAAAVTDAAVGSGYRNVWVRDNVYVAHAHYISGQPDIASKAARAIFEFFGKHRHRFEAIIAREADPDDVMNRPHIRFNGETLEELSGERWSHAQNDALGYALWLYSTLASAGVVDLDSLTVETLALFPRYFSAIRFWDDEDNGHWEETRRRSASSIGTATAGLEALVQLAQSRTGELRAGGFSSRLTDLTFDLIERGRTALDTILPNECVQSSPRQNRRYDAALLFLIHPLNVVSPSQARLILADIDRYLTSDHGIRRYLGDSYWAPDYDEHLASGDRTRDYSEDMAARDALLDRIGHEAEWCIFDPILSAYYGKRYRDTASPHDLERQTHHFERALAQITPTWQCPELYYMKHGEYIPNPHTPLLWTQANLMTALHAMRTNRSA